jgi:hypothetical protein
MLRLMTSGGNIAMLHFERRKKNILGTSEKINHRVGFFLQVRCSGYLTRCSQDISNEGFEAEGNVVLKSWITLGLNPCYHIY